MCKSSCKQLFPRKRQRAISSLLRLYCWYQCNGRALTCYKILTHSEMVNEDLFTEWDSTTQNWRFPFWHMNKQYMKKICHICDKVVENSSATGILWFLCIGTYYITSFYIFVKLGMEDERWIPPRYLLVLVSCLWNSHTSQFRLQILILLG